MLNLGAILAVVAGAGGILLSQTGSFIPSRREFLATLKLKRETCIEEHASSHCFLLKQFRATGVEDFDNVMRGDGRTSPDYFSEHSRKAVEAFNKYHASKGAEARFRIAHYLLMFSTILLILLGVAAAIWKEGLAFMLWPGLSLFAVEIVSIAVLYVLGDTNEGE